MAGAPCQSVLSDEGFGQRYAYGAAEGAALTSLEPWKIAAAVVGDMGQFLLGSVGWKPSQAIPENDDSKFLHSSCQYRCAKLKVASPFSPAAITIYCRLSEVSACLSRRWGWESCPSYLSLHVTCEEKPVA